MFGNRRLAHLGIAALLGAASACGGSESSQKAQGIDFDPAGYEGLEAAHFKLLSTYCTVDTGTTPPTLKLTVGSASGPDETLYLYYRTMDSKVVANAQKADGSECTAAATDRISIDGTALKNDTVIIDYMFGKFGVATAAGDPLIAMDLKTAAALGADVLQIRATQDADAITFGTNAGVTLANLQTVGAKTARNYADIKIVDVEAITVSSGPGNDTVTGQGGTAVGLTVGSSALDGAIAFTVYGGEGDDTLQAGAASVDPAFNKLSGGAGNDYFPQANVLANDVITGGEGVDTVDYSAKSSGVNVTIGKGTVATKGKATLTAVPKANILDNEYFEVSDADTTTRFAFKKTAVATNASALITFTGVGADNQTFLINDGTNSMTFCLTAGTTACPADDAGVTLRVATGADAAATAAALAAAITANAGAGKDLTDLSVTYVATQDHLTLTSITAGDTNLAVTEDVVDATAVVTDGLPAFVLSGANAGAVTVDISADSTAAQVASRIYTTVNANKTGLDISLTAPTADVVAFANTAVGALPSILVEAVANAGFTVANTAGSAASAGSNDDGVATEKDDIDTDVENIIGSASKDTIDASLATAAGHVLMGLDGDDTLIGSIQTGAANYIYGGKGNDTLVGGSEVDFLYGGEGDDTLQGGAKNDTMDGGGVNCLTTVSVKAAPMIPFASTTWCAKAASVGTDTVDYSERTAGVTVDLTPAKLAGCSGKTITGTEGEDGECDIIANIKNIRGTAFADTLTGDTQNNVIWGGAGDDTIYGGIGNDTLFGEDGNDTIYGCLNTSITLTSTQSDNDIIFGGSGTNTMSSEMGLDLIDATKGTNDTVDCGAGDGDILLRGSGTKFADGAGSSCEM